jgi:hypothetical protein
MGLVLKLGDQPLGHLGGQKPTVHQILDLGLDLRRRGFHHLAGKELEFG